MYFLLWWLIGVITAIYAGYDHGELNVLDLVILCLLSIGGPLFTIVVIIDKLKEHMPKIPWDIVVWKRKDTHGR